MLTVWREADGRSRLNLGVFACYLIFTALVGGASRADVLSQPLAYGAAVLMIGWTLPQLGAADWHRLRGPVLLLSALALVIAVQLIPLPQILSRASTGDDVYAQALLSINLGGGWRPVSLTPDLTLYSLIALLPAFAALLGAAVTRRALPAVIPVLLLICSISGIVGLLQITGSTPPLYRIANQGSAVGLFANRNHAAALLVAALPMLACWASWPHANPARQVARQWIALCVAAVLMPMLLVTGSRAGLVLGVAVAAMSFWMSFADAGSGGRRHHEARRRTKRAFAAGLVVLIPIVILVLTTRDQAVQRLFGGVSGELRLIFVPTYLEMVGDFFPLGSGFGSFDAVFRRYEPVAHLWSNYLNHAHNDPLELLIEGGLGAALVLAAFAIWLGKQVGGLWRGERSASLMLARTGAIILVTLSMWSLVDYPLRTPTLSALAALAAYLMTGRAGGEQGTRLGNPAGVR